jgi:hypothetical protein
MASGVRGGAGDAGEGEWLKVAELKAMAGAQDPQAKVCMFSFHDSSVCRLSIRGVICRCICSTNFCYFTGGGRCATSQSRFSCGFLSRSNLLSFVPSYSASSPELWEHTEQIVLIRYGR